MTCVVQTRFSTVCEFTHPAHFHVCWWFAVYMNVLVLLPPLRTVHCYSIFTTIWCVGVEFTSLFASQVSADTCTCCNWQIERIASFVIVQHYGLIAFVVATCCMCPELTKMLFQTLPLKEWATLHLLTFTLEFHEKLWHEKRLLR